ncbi:unnamed protein product [Alopecurus aequalis]
MMNVLSGHRQYTQLYIHHHDTFPIRSRGSSCQIAVGSAPSTRSRRPACNSSRRRGSAVRAVIGSGKDDDDEEDEKNKDNEVSSSSSSSKNRADLERLVGSDDDESFSGLDLATLIRKRYGRSYDVTLIRKEFMGRNLLAMNVMWKYREQRSFPLTEEEYLLRLDDVANTLRCWGAVAHVRNSLEKVRERPRIGKAVSIFIDMDTTGGARSNEWIYK